MSSGPLIDSVVKVAYLSSSDVHARELDEILRRSSYPKFQLALRESANHLYDTLGLPWPDVIIKDVPRDALLAASFVDDVTNVFGAVPVILTAESSQVCPDSLVRVIADGADDVFVRDETPIGLWQKYLLRSFAHYRRNNGVSKPLARAFNTVKEVQKTLNVIRGVGE